MIVTDTDGLLLLLDPTTSGPKDPATGLAVSDCQKRVQFLVSTLHANKDVIAIPTPVLAELAVLAGQAGPAYYERLRRAAAFEIVSFDARMAIELSMMTGSAIKAGDRKAGSTASAAKVKFDRQIVATAKVLRAHTILSSDENLRKFATNNGIKVLGAWDLPLPPRDAQTTMWDQLETRVPSDE